MLRTAITEAACSSQYSMFTTTHAKLVDRHHPGAPAIRYALVVTVSAPKHAQLHQDILAAHAVLQALEPQVSLPVRT